MAEFEKIAKPHSDILRGKFTLDTYAANLGDVVKGEGPAEYRYPKQFFQKTYMTEGLKQLLRGVERRVRGRGGDAVIQLQTPFGGGKTHTLITLFHKANEWKAKPVVIVGTEMEAEQTLWGEMEAQLTGKIQLFKGHRAPGSTKISELLTSVRKPIVILMDEVLNYLTAAEAVGVGRSTLAKQALRFVHNLTESVSACNNVALIATRQSGLHEDYGATSLSNEFKQLLDRMARVGTPVDDSEIANIIRSRLFSEVDESGAKRIVREFANYADRESILPPGQQKSEYRERFVASYPFQPEVIDVLYHRWGSFPNFQRTRGVLRLLSLVVHRCRGKHLPYISLADFDLGDADIRGELLRHAGNVFSGIISNDITAGDAGAKLADAALGDALSHSRFCTRAATAIFLYSFTGGQERGATLDQVKRSAVHPDNPSAVIDSAINQLNAHLFYLRTENGKSYFDTQPNLHRLVQIRMENVADEEVASRAEAQIKKSFTTSSGAKMKTFIAPRNGTDIPETPDLKLIVLPQRNDEFCRNVLELRGETPRIYRNTLFFLVPLSGSAEKLQTEMKRVLAYEAIGNDNSLNLSDAQQREVRKQLRHSGDALNDAVCQDYRILLIPTRDGFRAEDLGLPAHGMNTRLDEKVYETLCVKGELLSSIGPRNIAIRYLKDNDTVSTAQLYSSSLRTPGETRVLREAWITGIRQGVAQGQFGIGERMGGECIPRAFMQEAVEVTLGDNEVIIQPSLCTQQMVEPEVTPVPEPAPLPSPHPTPAPSPPIGIRFTLPQGRVSNVAQCLNALGTSVQIDLRAPAGQISQDAYEELLENLRTLGIVVEEV